RAWYLYSQPYGTHLVCLQVEMGKVIQHVGRQRSRKVLGFSFTAALGKFVRHHVADKPWTRNIFGKAGAIVRAKISEIYTDVFYFFASPQQQLGRNFFSFPPHKLCLCLCCDLGEYRFWEAFVDRYKGC